MIHRVHHGKEQPYFLMARAAAQDDDLNAEALAVHTYLLSKPDTWLPSATDIAKRFKWCKPKTYKVLNELLKLGYLARRLERVDGRITRWVMDVFETPVLLSRKLEVEKLEVEKLEVEKLEVEKLEVEKLPTREKRVQIRQKTNKEEKQDITEAPTGAGNDDVLLQPSAVPAQPSGAPPADPAPDALVAQLIAAGVSKGVARQLAGADPAECARQLAALPQRENVKSPGAFLAQAIRARYPAPAAAPQAERSACQRQELAAQQKRLTLAAEAERRYAQLTPAERAQRQAQAALEFEQAGLHWLLTEPAVRDVRLQSAAVARLAQEIAA